MNEFDLSELVKDCAPLGTAEKPKYHALEKMRELQELGLDWVAKQMRDKVLLAEKLECVAKEKYLVITPAKIQTFLNRKAKEYNDTLNQMAYRQQVSFSLGGLQGVFGSLQGQTDPLGWVTSQPIRTSSFQQTIDGRQFYAFTQDMLSPKADGVSGFMWAEVPVKDYQAIPPEHALKALKAAREKEIFDDFTIASVTKMKDPLLLGRLNGTEDRFFLAQWGDDISLDDVI